MDDDRRLALLESIGQQLNKPDYWRIVQSCLEVQLFDSDGATVSEMSVGTAIEYIAGGQDVDLNGQDLSGVRYAKVRVL